MLSCYVTTSPADWELMMQEAEKGETGLDLGKNITGRTLLEEKLAIVREYMQDYWNIDIDRLRSAVMHRGAELGTLDLETLN